MSEPTLLDPAGAAALIEGRADLRDVVGTIVSVEVFGEGKLNAVFGVRGSRGGVVLKQALPWVRILPEWALTIERVQREAWFLDTWARFNARHVPASYGLDLDRHVLAMQHLTDHVLWRTALHDGEVNLAAASSAGAMLARAAFFTSPMGQSPEEHARSVAASANPEMDALMVDVVFDIPFATDPRNTADPHLRDWRRRLTSDRAAAAAIATLRWCYTTRREAVLHGDLHTGSIMVAGDDVRVIDGEFSRHGPVAWDLGELWSHLALAADGHHIRGDDNLADAAAQLVPATWRGFTAELTRLWPERVPQGLGDDWLSRWLGETQTLAAQFAGLETLRRIVGVGTCEQLDLLDEPLRPSAADAAITRALTALKEGRWT